MKTLQLAGLALSASMMASGGAWAQQVPVPESCTPLVTVLKNSCVSTTVFDCGATRVAHTYASGAQVAIHVYASDWEFSEFRYPEENSVRMVFVEGSGSSVALDSLWESGETPADGQFLMSTGVIKDRAYTMSGRNELTGETTISDVPFRSGKIFRLFELTPGGGGLAFETDIYVSRDQDLFIEGAWQRTVFGNNLEVFDHTPYALAMPGDAAFLSDRSERGCE